MSTGKCWKLLDNNGKNLVVAFAGLGRDHFHMPQFNFERSLQSMQNLNADFLLMKDITRAWYIGTLPGIGGFNKIVEFLKKNNDKYQSVVYIGVSAGGYASILFGNMLKIPAVIAFEPQTNFDLTAKSGYGIYRSFKNRYPDMIAKYKNLRDHLNDSTQNYVYNLPNQKDLLHGHLNWLNICEAANVHRFPCTAGVAIKNGSLEKKIISIFKNEI